MFSKFAAIVLLAQFVFPRTSDAQECVGKSVQNLTLNAYHTLTWSLSEDEACEITGFYVLIWQIGFPHEYNITVTETEADVSFLEVCEEWTFIVVPISGYNLGHGRSIVQYLPLPADANISIAYLNATHDEATGDVHLLWDLADRRLGDCSLTYRLTVEEDGNPTIEDIFLDAKSIDLHFLPPCKAFLFTVRAINVANPTIEGPAKMALHHMPEVKQGRPTVRMVETGTHEANITWRLQSYARNPCRVWEIRLQDDGVFNLTVPFEDSTRRDDITISVDSLEPDTLYTVLAYVHNTAGWSEPAEVSFGTLASLEDDEFV